jgi:hypothetical protein
MPARSAFDDTRTTARLPGLDVEVLHRRTWDGGREGVQVTIQPVPLQESIARLFEAPNPMLMWMRMAEAAWAPWLAFMAPPQVPERKPIGTNLSLETRTVPDAD